MPSRDDQPPEGMLEVGRITKAHGLKGEVVVELTSQRAERSERGARFVVSEGELTIDRAKPHGGRWIVLFDGVSTRERAEELRGETLWAPPLDDAEGVLWVHELVGARVVEVDGTERGTVVSVQSNPASDLLELDTGALVPATFVVDGPEDGTVTVSTPPGLFEL